MDLFLAGCQGLGLALALGALLGAPGTTGAGRTVLLVLAAIGGALLFGASLTPEDHPAWPGWIAGAPAGALGFLAANRISLGAQGRAGEGAGAGVALIVGVVALALAGIVLLGPAAVISLVALVAAAALLVARRRKDAQKHAGLRTLR